MRAPIVSVIMPVHNREHLLREALRALETTDLSRDQWELVIVDDGTCDECVTVAARVADTVVRLPAPARGPAYARNRGVEVARADILVFLDADVAIRSDTLRRLVQVLESDASVAGVFGSYDDAPPARGVISKYWNLLRAFGCRSNLEDAGTFDASCGALRRSAWQAVNGFDEWHFQAPEIEDLELGHRLRGAGHRISLLADVQVTHLKSWSLRTMIRDAWRRGVMVGRLLDSGPAIRQARSDVLHTLTNATSLAACVSALAVLGGSMYFGLAWWGALGLSLVTAMAINSRVHGFLQRRGGLLFTLAVAPIHLAAQFISGVALFYGWLLRHLIGEPSPDPAIQAFAEVGVKTWPPIPRQRR